MLNSSNMEMGKPTEIMFAKEMKINPYQKGSVLSLFCKLHITISIN
jgi:hypothetical protein